MMGAMRGVGLGVALVAAILLGVWGRPAHAQGISVVDDRGVTVRLPRPPQRIVSLLPSITESVCALGACSQLVATDRWSNWPASVQALPKLGGLDDANVELIVAQKPDLVLVAPSSRVAPRLRALGLTVAELDAQELSQVQSLFRKIAVLIGQAHAADVRWRALQAEIDAARDQVAMKARGVRVYFEVGATPYAAGAASFIGQLLTRLGAVNVVPAELGPFPKLNPEFIVRARPDLIMIAADEADGLAARPGWAHMKAVAGHHVCAIPHADYDLLARPGPRLGQGAIVLARCLNAYANAQVGGRGVSR
jgi:iron complex transport system substrate-binding protein